MSSPSHYEVLGLTKNASGAEIKAAYRSLVKIYHPDINPTPEAKEKIRLINLAFEVLSDYYERSIYDGQLSGTHYYQKPPEETPEEKYRREYLRKKRKKEREHIEYVIGLKYKFYKYERMACMAFFVIGVLFTLDYYFVGDVASFAFEKIDENPRFDEVTINGGDIKIEKGLYRDFEIQGGEFVDISFSLVFGLPVYVNMPGSAARYDILGTLHSFENAFTVIVLICSFIVVSNKEYNDFRLTCGIIPAFLSLFLILFLIAST